MQTRILEKIKSYVLRSQPPDVETALVLTIPFGGFYGVTNGLQQAQIHQDGYIWRVLGCSALGVGAGFVAGVHYRQALLLIVSADITRSVMNKFKAV